jgi:hypothetical protein
LPKFPIGQGLAIWTKGKNLKKKFVFSPKPCTWSQPTSKTCLKPRSFC